VPATCQKESASCTVYAKGLIHWCERITSTLYTRERNRTSYFVKIRFIDGDGNAKEFAAVVRFFFKVNQMDAPGRQAAFAVLDVFKTDIIVDKDTGNLLRAREYTGHPEKNILATECRCGTQLYRHKIGHVQKGYGSRQPWLVLLFLHIISYINIKLR
jgi:hypothetical protein